ncbi:hypothetical protein CU669_12960 [Paramagnetospirillum kuznetsovii]|uniref:Lipoprotein n=1 Tax=Paramagnetospirillum kuznetsovii TaxID=2053833 RepID=A0A364NX21_9PROT|nr:hypothetical protein [Paramagnetospirillum kuznetsovii]RAU21596.1 hypothetical protein CU669_12960 [Paramagnetospirillum kuznetsovii]
MKALAVLSMILALGACAEVTTFRKPDGSTYYYVDCENTMRWAETCRFAARRTCPDGYVPLAITPIVGAENDRRYAQCVEENQDRVQEGQAEQVCARTPHREGFFACK